MAQWNWKYIIIFILAIPVVNYLTGYVARQVTEKEVANSLVSNLNQDIRVIVSSQDAEGVTQKNFDLNFLKNLEAYMVKRIKLKNKEYFTSQGKPNINVDFKSEATYVESGLMKLAIIRFRLSEGATQVFIVGIVRNELKRVLCLRNSAVVIPISYGICADKIKEVFGEKIGA